MHSGCDNSQLVANVGVGLATNISLPPHLRPQLSVRQQAQLQEEHNLVFSVEMSGQTPFSIPPLIIHDAVVPMYITEIKDKTNSDLLDGFYARLLINVKGLYEYVKSCDASGSHAPTATPTNTLYGMNKHSIYKLIERMRSIECTEDIFIQLRNCYAQTGFLVFTDDWKNVFVYSEDASRSNLKKWLETAQNDGPASWEVYNEFVNFWY